jgi:hypothetical protein
MATLLYSAPSLRYRIVSTSPCGGDRMRIEDTIPPRPDRTWVTMGLSRKVPCGEVEPRARGSPIAVQRSIGGAAELTTLLWIK